MPRTTPIEKVMTPRVLSLGVDAKLSEVRRLFREEGCHHVPILDGGRVAGVISSRDLLALLRGSEAAGADEVDALLDGSGTVQGIMTRDLVTMRTDESVDVAIDLIAGGRVHSVLVVDAEGRLAGIVTDSDLLAYLG